MIYSNNFYYLGATAILYNFECDYPSLEMTPSIPYYFPDESAWKSATGISEIGIEYKKSTDTNWTTIVLPYPGNKNFPSSSQEDQYEYCYEDTNYLYSIVRANYGLYANGILQPIRIVIKNLDVATSYDIRSYYIKNNITNTFNTCEVTTLATAGGSRCTGVSGGTTEQNNILKATCDESCDIYNSMGSTFSHIYAAQVGGTGGAAATSDMHFAVHYIDSLPTVAHEMAHNIMRIVNYNPDFYNGVDQKAALWNTYNSAVMKFMEFASHVEGANWRWQGEHNYPVISPHDYNKVGCYYVAAGCHLSRTASEGY